MTLTDPDGQVDALPPGPRPAGAPTPERRRSAVASLVCALLLAVLLFPEVVFGGGSFSAIGLDDALGGGEPSTVQVYPNLEHREPASGLVDIGARVWQFEPEIAYVARALRSGSNLDWNPYQASGSLGPETLTGAQMSPFVLAVAGLGGSPTAFTVVLMALIVLTLYCLQQFFVRSLGMRRIAGIAACVVFMLNGWVTATLTSVTCLPYLMLPILLYSVVEFQRRPGPARLLLAVAAYSALFATTFTPGQFLDVVLVTAVAFVIDAWRRRDAERGSPVWRRAVGLAARQAIVPGIALLAASFIVFPALDAFRHAGADIESYSQRSLFTRGVGSWLLLPSYLLQKAKPESFYDRSGLFVYRQWEIYLGVAPVIFTVAAFPRATRLARWLLVALGGLALFGLAQHMGLPGLKLIGDLPGLRIIYLEYWAALIAGALAIAFGVAVETAANHGISVRLVIATAAVLGMAALVVGYAGAWDRPGRLAVTVTLAVIAAVVLVSWLDSIGRIRHPTFACVAVALVALELGAYANHTRVKRMDPQADAAGFISYVQDHIGDGRALNAGRATMVGNWGSAFGIRQVGTHDVMQIPAYRDFYLAYIGGSPSDKFLGIDRSPDVHFVADATALDLLSVRFLVVDQDDQAFLREVSAAYPLVYEDRDARVSVFANPDAFPRAFLTPALRGLEGDGPSRGLDSAPPLTFSRAVTETADPTLLAEGQAAGLPPTATTPLPSDQARITHDGSTKVAVSVDASQPSVLVLADTYHPNWSVMIDGAPAHVGPVDSVARGVIVPAGHSEVVFTYQSPARSLGEAISGVTVVLLLGGCGAWAMARRRRPAAEAIGDGSVAVDVPSR